LRKLKVQRLRINPIAFSTRGVHISRAAKLRRRVGVLRKAMSYVLGMARCSTSPSAWSDRATTSVRFNGFSKLCLQLRLTAELTANNWPNNTSMGYDQSSAG
jgi:hypothetical protein